MAEVTALGVPKPPDREAVFSSTSQACAGCQLYNCALCNGLDHESRTRLAAIVESIVDFSSPTGSQGDQVNG